jgi:hypothetical protein
LSSPGFNPLRDLDMTSLRFGRTGTEASLAFCVPASVERDRRVDLICLFNTRLTGFQPGDTQGHLTGETRSGVAVEGTDSVRIVK